MKVSETGVITARPRWGEDSVAQLGCALVPPAAPCFRIGLSDLTLCRYFYYYSIALATWIDTAQAMPRERPLSGLGMPAGSVKPRPRFDGRQRFVLAGASHEVTRAGD